MSHHRTALVVALLLSGCASETTQPSDDVKRILFIGNSLTYVNDLPGMLQALADSAGRDEIDVVSVVAPNFALVDHWNTGEALDSINNGGWDLVVLQQGPSSLQVNRDSLRLLAGMFNEEIVRTGGRAALYSVWPTSDRQQDFTRAIESYHLASMDVGGLFLPVATAWLIAWEIDSNMPLYSDGLHASVEGTYLAALVMYARIFDATPVGLATRFQLRNGDLVDVGAAPGSLLQQAAASATAGVPGADAPILSEQAPHSGEMVFLEVFQVVVVAPHDVDSARTKSHKA